MPMLMRVLMLMLIPMPLPMLIPMPLPMLIPMPTPPDADIASALSSAAGVFPCVTTSASVA
jgi:hypothetical protein